MSGQQLFSLGQERGARRSAGAECAGGVFDKAASFFGATLFDQQDSRQNRFSIGDQQVLFTKFWSTLIRALERTDCSAVFVSCSASCARASLSSTLTVTGLLCLRSVRPGFRVAKGQREDGRLHLERSVEEAWKHGNEVIDEAHGEGTVRRRADVIGLLIQ